MNWYIVILSLMAGWCIGEMLKHFLKSPEYRAVRDLASRAVQEHEALVVTVMLALWLAVVLIAFIVVCIKDNKEMARVKEGARLYDMMRAEELERKRLAKCADWSSIAESEWKSECPCL